MTAKTTVSPARLQYMLEQMSPEEMKAFEDKAFDAWMGRVDAAFILKLGLTSRDLPDFAYRDAFDRGDAPAETVMAWVESYGDEFGLDPDEMDFE